MMNKLTEVFGWESNKTNKNWAYRNSSSKSKLKVYIVEPDKKTVGFLYYKDRKFAFKYDKNCTEKIEGLSEFQGEDLHSFFKTRIPHKYRRNIAEDYKKYENDPILILGNLGAESALSKYKFEAVLIE